MDGLVVIAGATGFIGRYVVQQLAKTGVRIRVIARNPNAALFLKPLGGLGQIDLVAGDLRSPATLLAACRGATAAVNLVGILDESSQKFADVQAQGATDFATAAAKAGASTFVHVSAIGADAASPAKYARSKALGEAGVRAVFPAATILRPSVVFGPEDAFLNRFAGMARSLPVLPVVAGNTRFQPVYVGDVATAVVTALARPSDFAGQDFDLGGPTVYSFRELMAWIAREIRVDTPVVEVPDFIASTMASLSGYIPGMPMTRDQWLMLQSDNVAANSGCQALGIEPTSLEAVAPAYLERFRTAGRFHQQRAA